MFRHSWLALALIFGGGCSGTDTTKTTDVGGDDDDDDDDDTTEPRDSEGFGGDTLDEIAAVGFEFEGILLGDGTFTSFNYSSYEILPTMYMKFTTAAYFAAATTLEQDEQSCIAYGTWMPPGPLGAGNDIPAVGGATLNWSWELPLLLEYSNCQDKMDPAVWDEILTSFTGARFGMGLSTMNNAFMEKWGILDYTKYIDDYEEFGMVEYIALNDRDGDFLARNWNVAWLYQWDSSTGELVVDDGYLVPLPVGTTPAGSPLPEGYLRSSSFWYADFCSYLDNNGYQASAEEGCIDMTNLHDGAR